MKALSKLSSAVPVEGVAWGGWWGGQSGIPPAFCGCVLFSAYSPFDNQGADRCRSHWASDPSSPLSYISGETEAQCGQAMCSSSTRKERVEAALAARAPMLFPALPTPSLPHPGRSGRPAEATPGLMAFVTNSSLPGREDSCLFLRWLWLVPSALPCPWMLVTEQRKSQTKVPVVAELPQDST